MIRAHYDLAISAGTAITLAVVGAPWVLWIVWAVLLACQVARRGLQRYG
jgi:hypothetical protein